MNGGGRVGRSRGAADWAGFSFPALGGRPASCQRPIIFFAHRHCYLCSPWLALPGLMSGRGSECGSGPYACCRQKGQRASSHRPGKGEPLNLLVIGDSSAASVGIGSTDHGIARPACRLVSSRTGRPVAWRAAGYNSATGPLPGPPAPFSPADLRGAQSGAGRLGPTSWDRCRHQRHEEFSYGAPIKAEFGGLLYALRAKWPEAEGGSGHRSSTCRLVPALPPLLGRVLEIRARLLNHVGTQLCVERGARRRLAAAGPRTRKQAFRATASMRRKPATAAWAQHLLPFVMEEIAIEDVSEPSTS